MPRPALPPSTGVEVDPTSPTTLDGWPRRAMLALACTGTIGTALIVAAIAIEPQGAQSGLEHLLAPLQVGGVGGAVAASVAFFAGLILVFSAWILLGLLLRRGASLRPLAGISVAWGMPLVLGPPLFSRDGYSYAALGHMVNAGLNPYHVGPSMMGSSPFVYGVSDVWRNTPSPYGPLFISVASWIDRVAGDSVARAILVQRLLEVVALVLIGVALVRIARATGKDPARALWLGVCNPLVLLHFVGGAHNDALMLALILSGLAMWVANRPVAGVVLCTLAAAIKVPAGIAAVFIIVDVVRRLPPNRRVVALVQLGGAGALTFAVVTWVSRLGWGWVGALGIPGTNHVLLTPTTFAASAISAVVGHDAGVLTIARGAGAAATALGVAYLLWRAPRIGTVRACGLAMALVVAFGPIVFPWYALWGVVLLAPAGRRIERGYAIFASVVLAVVIHPTGAAMADPVLIAAVLLLSGVAIAIAWHPVRRWIRADLVAAIEEYRRRGRAAELRTLVRRAVPDALARSREAVPEARGS